MDIAALVVAIIAALFGGVALIYSHKSNTIAGTSQQEAHKSNMIAEEARDLAFEANDISRRTEKRDTERNDVSWSYNWDGPKLGVCRIMNTGTDVAISVKAIVVVDSHHRLLTADSVAPGEVISIEFQELRQALLKKQREYQREIDEHRSRAANLPYGFSVVPEPIGFSYKADVEVTVSWVTELGSPRQWSPGQSRESLD